MSDYFYPLQHAILFGPGSNLAAAIADEDNQ